MVRHPPPPLQKKRKKKRKKKKEKKKNAERNIQVVAHKQLDSLTGDM